MIQEFSKVQVHHCFTSFGSMCGQKGQLVNGLVDGHQLAIQDKTPNNALGD